MSDTEWIRVPPSGRLDARIVLIGEAPSHHEVQRGEPFVGPAGQRLNEWLKAAGLRRLECYILNVLEYMAPGNKLDAVPKDQLLPWFDYLHERLAALTDPWLIVPMGNYPLYALTGLGSVSWHKKDGAEVRPGITKWRGSLLSYTDRQGRLIKVIPTCHPSATFRQPSLEAVCRKDWRRIAEEVQDRALHLPIREHIISPSLGDLADLQEAAATQVGPKLLALDIENPKRRITVEEVNPDTGKLRQVKRWSAPAIVAVGLSMDAAKSITVPTTLAYWKSPERLDACWKRIQAICEDPRTEKVLHNSFYDRYHLADRGIQLVNMQWDTMFMSHAMHPTDEHSLGYRASVDTREPYWKSMGKDEGLWAEHGSAYRAFLIYNGKDVCVTMELARFYLQRMAAEKRDCGFTTLEFYQQMYVPLLDALHLLSRQGMLVDDLTRRRRLAILVAQCIDLQLQLKELTGRELYGKKSLSGAKLKEFLYKDCGLPTQYTKRDKQGTKTASTNEVALRKLLNWIAKHREKQPELAETATKFQLPTVLNLVLEHQRAAQLSTFYKEERIDPDGRFRSEYSPNTDAGRLSSKKNPRGTGGNAQNQDREARDIFLPEPGQIGLNVDLSAIESRLDDFLIYHLTGNQQALYRATVSPLEFDEHLDAASAISGVAYDTLRQWYQQDKSTSEYKEAATWRYFGKKTKHGIFRDVGANKLVEEILKDGRTVLKEEAQGWIDTLRQKIGGIDELFRWFRRQVLEKGYIENSWGRRMYCPEVSWERLGSQSNISDELWRAVYSFWPQSECADLMNQWGFLPLHRKLHGHPEIGTILAHVHDSLFISVDPQHCWEVANFLVESLTQPRVLFGKEFRAHCTVEIGVNWKGSKEWKSLPSKGEMQREIDALIPLIGQP